MADTPATIPENGIKDTDNDNVWNLFASSSRPPCILNFELHILFSGMEDK